MKMIDQKEIFQATEGDQWFERNSTKSGVRKAREDDEENDQIVTTLKALELEPGKVLEIGCSNGTRLNSIQKEFGGECCGIDPSSRAIEDGKETYPELSLNVGTADHIPFDAGTFDTIIFGFCLYLCDRADLFKIACEADRCLKNNGTLVIKDFFPTFPFKNKYSHLDGIYSYKMDYSKMFTWNPCYSEISNDVFTHSGYTLRDIPNEKVAIVILRKSEEYAYPEDPFGKV